MDMSTSEDCPFNEISMKIAFNIIEYLNLETRKSLALTCRKWYETLLALPEPNRCIVNEYNVEWNYNALFRDGGKRTLICTPQTKFNLVQKLKIRKIDLLCSEMRDCTIYDFFRFLMKNSHHIEINGMLIWDQLNERELSWLDASVDIPKSITINTELGDKYSSDEQLSYNQLVETIIKRHLSNSSIRISQISEIETIATILQQWTRGERPNLESFNCKLPARGRYDRQTLEETANLIVRGLGNYVGPMTKHGSETRPELTFKVTVFGIGVMNAKLVKASFEMSRHVKYFNF